MKLEQAAFSGAVKKALKRKALYSK